MKYRYHLGINIIRCYSQRLLSFYFSVVDKSTVLREIRKLSVKNVIQDTDIPKNEEFFADQIYLQRNEGVSASQFPASFKFENATPAFKQGSKNVKDNCRPISILPIVSKDFKKLMCKQLPNHFDNLFSRF